MRRQIFVIAILVFAVLFLIPSPGRADENMTPNALATVRPLDFTISVSGAHTPNEWIEFVHDLGDNAERLYPLQLYNQDYSQHLGVGKTIASFAPGTLANGLLGDGSDGDLILTTATDLNPIRARASGNLGSYLLTISDGIGAAFQTGQVVLIHQSRGNNAGLWELNQIQSVDPGQLTLKSPLLASYLTDSQLNRAQVLWVPQYHNLTVQSGVNIQPANWDRFTGGIVAVMSNGKLLVDGAINAVGASGASANNGGPTGGVGAGFRGGNGDVQNTDCKGRGVYGEGTDRIVLGEANEPTPISGNAGKGSDYQDCNGGDGGGGGNGTAGQPGIFGRAGDLGPGGLAVGNEALTLMTFGGGGAGSSGEQGQHNGGGGGAGGGIVLLMAKEINVNGWINVSGGNGGGNQRGAGGGAGGSVLLKGESVALGSNLIKASGGVGGFGEGGGDGGLGRIHIDYCESFSGFTNPSETHTDHDCYRLEKAETVPFSHARLRVPASLSNGGNAIVQYGQRVTFVNGGIQNTTLRIPSGAYTLATIDALVRDVGSSNLNLRLDVGSDGTWDWETTATVKPLTTLNSQDLSAAFTDYWRKQGSPVSGSLNVPITFYASQSAEIFLTNLVMVKIETAIPTSTVTPTFTPTSTSTATSINTPSHTPTATVTIAATSIPTSTAIATPLPTTAKTLVLIYAGLDNNLQGDWTRLVNNIEKGVTQTATIRLFIDGPGDKDAWIYDIKHDTQDNCPNQGNFTCDANYLPGSTVHKASENSAAQMTLANFISESVTLYPNAPQLVLALVGHGSGWSAGVLPGESQELEEQPRPWNEQPRSWNEQPGALLWDDYPGADKHLSHSLSIKALDNALYFAQLATGKTIDLLYLDGCSLGMVEVAYEVRNHAQYMLASPNTDWTSFTYDKLLSVVNPSQRNARQLGESWLELDAESIRQASKTYPFTYSLVDLSKLEEVKAATTTLADELINLLADNKTKIYEAFDATDKYESNYNGLLDHLDAYSDLYSFAIELGKRFPNNSGMNLAVQSVQSSLNHAVVKKVFQAGTLDNSSLPWNWNNYGGLGIYLPLGRDEERRPYYTQFEIMWAYGNSWDEFLGDYYPDLSMLASGIPNEEKNPLLVCLATTDAACVELAKPLPFERTIYLPLISK